MRTKTRHCNKCNKTKFLSLFAVDRSNKYGRAYRCRECCNECRRLSRKRPDVKRKDQNYNLRTKYGITVEQQEALLLSQQNKCAICKTTKPGGKYNKWQTDHNHNGPKRVRGLLCYRCNSGIGQLNENPKTLINVLSYLCEGVVS